MWNLKNRNVNRKPVLYLHGYGTCNSWLRHELSRHCAEMTITCPSETGKNSHHVTFQLNFFSSGVVLLRVCSLPAMPLAFNFWGQSAQGQNYLFYRRQLDWIRISYMFIVTNENQFLGRRFSAENFQLSSNFSAEYLYWAAEKTTYFHYSRNKSIANWVNVFFILRDVGTGGAVL